MTDDIQGAAQPPAYKLDRRELFELPLLQSLIECGGSCKPKAPELYEKIAAKIALTPKEQEFDDKHNCPRWVYDMQWVRYELVRFGDMDGSQRGTWAITDKGRERVKQGLVSRKNI